MSRARGRCVVTAAAAIALFASRAEGAPECHGPPDCCPPKTDDRLEEKQTVTLGVSVEGIHNLDEKAGGWDVDYYLYESWKPHQGFTPQTEIVNEIARQKTPLFDRVELLNKTEGKVCRRSRHLHSTLRVDYDLSKFPFDRQELLLTLSDAQYDSDQLSYGTNPSVAEIDDSARAGVLGWSLDKPMGYERKIKRFKGEEGRPFYDYGIFSVPVQRQTIFHLTKYFLPLIVIVLVSFGVFWIDPERLNVQVSISMTCLLAAIALQFSESRDLPAVSYLTFADRVYVLCYLAIALTLMESIYSASVFRRDQSVALRIERGARLLISAALFIAVGIAIVLSFI